MTRRLNGPAGACAAFLFVATLVGGGLGWVTHAALQVEASHLAATARAEQSNKERLALWRLDSQMLPAFGLENNRPFAHYAALHATYSAVDVGNDVPARGAVRLPSPLLSADLPPWMLLHFQIDPETGWESPQVLTTELADRLQAEPLNLSLSNCTDPRRSRLADLEAKFPAHEILRTLGETERTIPDDTPFVVPVPQVEEAAAAKRSGGWAATPPAPATDTAAAFPAAVEVAIERPVGTRPVRGPQVGVIPANVGRVPLPRPNPTPNTLPPTAPPPALPQPTAGPLNPGIIVQYPVPPTFGTAPDPRPTAPTVAVAPSVSQSVVRSAASNTGWYANKSSRSADVQQSRDDSANATEWNGRLQLANKVFEGRGSYETQGKAGANLIDRNAPDKQTDGKAEAKPLNSFNNVGGGKGGGIVVLPAEADAVAQTLYGMNAEKAKETAEQLKEACKKAGPESEPARKLNEVCDEVLANLRGEGKGKGLPPGAGAPGRPEDLSKKDPSHAADQGKRDLERLIAGLPKTGNLAGAKPGEAAAGPVAPVGLPVAAGVRKPAPGVRAVPVQVGPLRPHWLTAADGTEILVLVRAAKVDDKTVFQGVLLDWPGLRGDLSKQVSDLFPAGTLTPVRTPEELVPERAMTALPAQLDPGPLPPPAAAGWTPLRLGLALAWAAALVALAAVWVGGWTLLKLSERRIRFVSAVTHELRTPLTSMRLYLDLLTSGMIRDEAKQQEYLTTLAAESARLNQLVENVLDFAKLEKRSVRACRQATPVGDLVGQVRDTWADRCAAEGKELVVIATVPAGQKVNTDLRIAAQIVGNLVDNARKYARDAADPRIWVWAKPGERGRVVFEVEDRGPGVPPRERGTVFRAFRRGKHADGHTGGAGLGLALAKQWADMLGGTLSYRPADGGVGACFRLELPGA